MGAGASARAQPPKKAKPKPKPRPAKEPAADQHDELRERRTGEAYNRISASNQLRAALERDRDMPDDRAAAELLLEAGRRALLAIEDLQDDDALWEKLGSGRRERLTTEEVRQLEELAAGDFESLLVKLEYQEPPPVAELVDEVVTSLALAVEGDGSRDAVRQVAEARRNLSIFAIRLRRLVGASQSGMPPSLARRLLRRVDEDADAILTAAAPVLLEAAAEILFPGSGLVIKLGAAAGGVAAARLLRLRPSLAPEADTSSGLEFTDALAKARRAAARLRGQAELVDALAQAGEIEDAAHELTYAQAWAVDEAIRQAIAADEGDRHGLRDGLARALEALRHARWDAQAGKPMTRLVEAVERVLDQYAAAAARAS